MTSFLKTYAHPGTPLQPPFAAAVIMPSLLRPQIGQALRSVFAQDLAGRVQVLIGLDQPMDLAPLEAICAERPEHVVVQVFYPGFCTSARRGGLSQSWYGGALRSMLSHMANSPYLAYLDDDNWWRQDHLGLLHAQMARAEWAFSLRWFCHPTTRQPICVDVWESVGPGRGVYVQEFGGFVDPNCLMLNKLACNGALHQWNRAVPGVTRGRMSDRSVFDFLVRHHRAAPSGQPTAFYTMNATDESHPTRVGWMAEAYARAGEGLAP